MTTTERAYVKSTVDTASTLDQTKKGVLTSTPVEQKKRPFSEKKPILGCKDRDFFVAKQKIRWRILRGGTYSQAELATITGLKPYRIPAIIQDLRQRDGLLIREERPYQGRTYYWLETPDTSLSIAKIIRQAWIINI